MSITWQTLTAAVSVISTVSFAAGWIVRHTGVIKRIGRWLSFTGNVLQEAPDTVSAVKSGDGEKVMVDLKAFISGIRGLLSRSKDSKTTDEDGTNDK